jgi:beta-glucanase (GH16 family)
VGLGAWWLWRPTAQFAAAPSWRQDFTTMSALDTSIWRYETDPAVPSYNHELQTYTQSSQNIRIEPGAGLVMQARKEATGYTSARIDTRDSFSFEYGKIEATMKLPAGNSAWPAFWLLSANQIHTKNLNADDAQWQQDRFYMKDGELDIMESYGDVPHQVEATVHTYNESKAAQTMVPDGGDQFHTYAVELTPTKITWTIDGAPYCTYTKKSDDPDAWPFGHGNRLYPILNVALKNPEQGALDDAKSPWTLQVQSVKYFPYTGR